jgi:site-specific DNA-methyltransferase (adenine-specific)
MKQYYDKKPGFEDKRSGFDKKGFYNEVAQDTVFNIPAVFNMSKEYQGYPTQKPLALLKRIIEASSNTGDIVLDPFCGCATTMVAAQQLGRK